MKKLVLVLALTVGACASGRDVLLQQHQEAVAKIVELKKENNALKQNFYLVCGEMATLQTLGMVMYIGEDFFYERARGLLYYVADTFFSPALYSRSKMTLECSTNFKDTIHS